MIEFAGQDKNNNALWKCICSCSERPISILTGVSLRKGHATSCGCMTKDRLTTHGQGSHALYQTWRDMNRRCYDLDSEGYLNYGGRGIEVCEKWRHTPVEFIHWCEEKSNWFEGCGLTLERKNNDDGYGPDNCRFADRTIQSINQRIRKDNTSGQKGVNFDKKAGKWVARISVNKKRKLLGWYSNLEDAKNARISAELKYYSKLLPH